MRSSAYLRTLAVNRELCQDVYALLTTLLAIRPYPMANMITTVNQLSDYFGKRNLIIASLVALVIAFCITFTTAFAEVTYHPDGSEVNSWDTSWVENHQEYLANEANDNRMNNSNSNSNNRSYTNFRPSNNSNSYNNSQNHNSSISYHPDGSEVNSWDTSWIETHQEYLANESRNNRNNNSRSNSTSYNNYYRENARNNRIALERERNLYSYYSDADYYTYDYYEDYDYYDDSYFYDDSYDDYYDSYNSESYDDYDYSYDDYDDYSYDTSYSYDSYDFDYLY